MPRVYIKTIIKDLNNDRKAMALSNEINDKLELFTTDNDITRINNIIIKKRIFSQNYKIH